MIKGFKLTSQPRGKCFGHLVEMSPMIQTELIDLCYGLQFFVTVNHKLNFTKSVLAQICNLLNLDISNKTKIIVRYIFFCPP